jgi:uncharacterized delta-60 repeat protein
MLNRLIVGLTVFGLWGGELCRGQVPGTIFEFTLDSFFAFEDAETATVEVRRTGDLGQSMSVDYTAAGGIAVENVDFIPQSGTLVFAANEEVMSFTVPYIDDAEPEGSEPIELSLSNPTGDSFIGPQNRARLYIQDNERRGTLVDGSFDGAIATGDFVSALSLLPDGRIMAAGSFERRGTPIIDRVLLFDIDGSRDRDFDMEDEFPNSSVFSMAVQPDGKVLIGGTFTRIGEVDFNRIARINRDGTIDPSFAPGGGVEGDSAAVFEIELQADGKILIGGPFDTYDGVSRVSLARLNPDGSLDLSFDLGDGIVSQNNDFSGPWVSRIRSQADGKILIGGQFTDVGGVENRNIARLDEDGSVDSTFFAGRGPTGSRASVEALAIQADGKVLIGGDFSAVDGNETNGIARLNPDGSYDESFDAGLGVEGINPGTGVSGPGLVTNIDVLADGKILASGNFETIDDFGRRGIGRLLPDGTLDGTFGPYFGTTYRNEDGYEEYNSVSAVVIQDDGKLITGALFEGTNGSSPARLSRLLVRNALENTVEFDFPRLSVSEGEETLEVSVIRRGQSDAEFTVDYFVLGGTATVGEDYEAVTGTLSFGVLETVKMITIPIISDAVAEDNETIELAIRNASNGVGFGEPVTVTIEIIDRTKPGNVDLNFDRVAIPFTTDPLRFRPVTDILIQPDGKVVVAGYFTFVNEDDRAGIVRFNQDGSIDDTFVPETPMDDLIVEFVQMGLQPDGSLVGGLRALRQLDSDGRLNPDFAPNVSFATSLVVQDDGKFIVGDNFLDPATGGSLNEVVRFNADGSIDSGFIPAALNDWAVTSVAQADGKVVLGGWFSDVNGVGQNRLVRLNENGSRDRSFDIGLGIEGVDPPVVIVLLEQPDGKILVGGEFSLADGLPRTNLARLNSDGSVDTSFDPGNGTDAWIESLAVQQDGKILIGGGFSIVDGFERAGFARLNANGSLDEDFAPVLFFPESRVVSAIEVQEDGQILIGGSFTEVNGLSRIGLARLNGDDAASIVPPVPDQTPEPEPTPEGTPPVIQISSIAGNGAYQIVFDAVIGVAYEIQSTAQIGTVPVQWDTLATIQATTESVSFVDPESPSNIAERFYRVLLPTP